MASGKMVTEEKEEVLFAQVLSKRWRITDKKGQPIWLSGNSKCTRTSSGIKTVDAIGVELELWRKLKAADNKINKMLCVLKRLSDDNRDLSAEVTLYLLRAEEVDRENNELREMLRT